MKQSDLAARKKVTKCDSNRCPRRKECYRASAPAIEWMSWTDFFHGGLNCGKFMGMTNA